jgi:hypothetical protein
VFYVNEFHCHDYAMLRGGLAVGLATAGLLALLLRKRIVRQSVLAVAALLFAIVIVNVPVPAVETDTEGFLIGGRVNHVDLDCAELSGTLSLVGGRMIVTDTSEDEQCYEHMRPLIFSGRILLAGSAVIFILIALGRADSTRAFFEAAAQRDQVSPDSQSG